MQFAEVEGGSFRITNVFDEGFKGAHVVPQGLGLQPSWR
jgi:hypothetical protein